LTFECSQRTQPSTNKQDSQARFVLVLTLIRPMKDEIGGRL